MKLLGILSILVAASALSGCASRSSGQMEVGDVASQESIKVIETDPGAAANATTHIETFAVSDVLKIGTRGANHVCGGASEAGVKDIDTREHVWTLPARTPDVGDREVDNITLRFEVGDGGHHGEAELLDPEGLSIGRAYHMKTLLAATQELESAKGFHPGDYKIIVRICLGADAHYNVVAHAGYR